MLTAHQIVGLLTISAARCETTEYIIGGQLLRQVEQALLTNVIASPAGYEDLTCFPRSRCAAVADCTVCTNSVKPERCHQNNENRRIFTDRTASMVDCQYNFFIQWL